MVNNCVVQGCVDGTAKQNVTLREFPKASGQDASYGGVSYRRLEATGSGRVTSMCAVHTHDAHVYETIRNDVSTKGKLQTRVGAIHRWAPTE